MSSEQIRKRYVNVTVITLYPKDGAKGKNIREIYSAGQSIRISIGLINRSIRPMVSSFRRSKCLSVELDTRHFRGGSSSTTIFTYAFSSMLFCAPLTGLAASIGLHEFLSSVVPRIKFHRCINNRGADERHTESVETSFGLIRSDDTVPRCVLVSFTR